MTISIIICCRHEEISPQLKENIQSTIFCDSSHEYQIIVIDNHNNQYSIFEAYNRGVQVSTGDILCFMHDDIEYQTVGWGDKVVSLFEDSNIDACAVIGSSYLRKAPTYTNHGRFSCMNMIYEGNRTSINADKVRPIVVFDGFWFCVRKRCFQHVYFDDQTYGGFHFYDMDTALQLFHAGYHTVFIPDVFIFHSYGANFNNQWLDNSFAFYHKWKGLLPLSAIPEEIPTEKEARNFNLQALYSTLRQIVKFRRWDKVREYLAMTREVSGQPAVLTIFQALVLHFRLKRHQ